MTLKKQSAVVQAFEILIFSFAIGGIGYFINPNDPFLVHSTFSFMILWLAVVTLFYGLTMGIVMWTSFAIMSFFSYRDDTVFTSILLENLFFVFLYGFFFSSLHEEMNKFKIKTKYLQLRLKELTNAFFTLKISHDKLESIYIIQPASFRFVISEILESSDHNTPKESANNTLRVLQKFFSVNSAMIWRVKGNKLHHHFASIGKIDTEINTNDKLIEEVLTYKKAIYLNELDDKKQTSYLYAVPFIDKTDTMVAILIIKDIPFLSYNEDTLLKINVVFNYIWTEYKKRASLDRITRNNQELIAIDNKHERQDIVDFKLEVIRLNNILNDYKIDSRIYAITTDNEYLDIEIKDFLYENELFEILDQYISVNCKTHYVHFLLFPLVSRPNLHDKIKDIDEKLDYIETQLRITMLEDGLKSHLNKTNFERLNKKNISVKNFNALLQEYDCAG